MTFIIWLCSAGVMGIAPSTAAPRSPALPECFSVKPDQDDERQANNKDSNGEVAEGVGAATQEVGEKRDRDGDDGQGSQKTENGTCALSLRRSCLLNSAFCRALQNLNLAVDAIHQRTEFGDVGNDIPDGLLVASEAC